jgi:5-methylcytosine-specific restriction endonuclease McrA
LINEGIKEHKCELCGITEWNGKPAPIELDHINGKHTDNRIENLRILCPNCHAQTPTWRKSKSSLKQE